MRLHVLTATIALSLSTQAFGLQWVHSQSESCKTVCSSRGQYAIQSGTWSNGNPFYICSANVGNEGFRGGWNVVPWANKCTIAYGSSSVGATDFYCLCG